MGNARVLRVAAGSSFVPAREDFDFGALVTDEPTDSTVVAGPVTEQDPFEAIRPDVAAKRRLVAPDEGEVYPRLSECELSPTRYYAKPGNLLLMKKPRT